VLDPLNAAILVGAGLLVASVLTSVLSFRFGAPLLLLFLGVGLLAGEDGVGGIDFDDPAAAYLIGSVALAIILFESGFSTRAPSLRSAAAPAAVLATFGVVASAAVVALAARYVLGWDWTPAFLIGAVLSSTDAAAVFFLLRVGGITIRERVRSTLEIESGSNDPFAIFLVVTTVELAGAGDPGDPLAWAAAAASQIGLGAAGGLAGGLAISWMLRRLGPEPGLSAVASVSAALLLFGAVSVPGGSGFLAVYLAGLLAGNRRGAGTPTLRRFQEGMTWLSQIVMFLALGLFATPSQFLDVLGPALLLAGVLVFAARPLAVWLCLAPFRFGRAETAFVAWVGVRGAVSILLGLVPILGGVPGAREVFDVAFVVVLASLLVQGWTVRPLARRLRLIVPPRQGPVDRIELELPGVADHELVAYVVQETGAAARGDRLPRWARPALVLRAGRVVRPHEAGELRPGDRVYLFAPPDRVPLFDRVYGGAREHGETERAFFGDLEIRPDAPVAALAEMYGLPLPAMRGGQTVADLLAERLGPSPEPGDRVPLGGVDLVVRDAEDGVVVSVGLDLEPEAVPDRRIPAFLAAREVLREAAGALGRLRFLLWQRRERRRERRRSRTSSRSTRTRGPGVLEGGDGGAG
jgi:cell volume regulation protein A